MNLEKIKSITISLLKKNSDINEQNQVEYLKKATAKFTIPSDFPKTEEAFSLIMGDMYNDILATNENGDSIGLWLEYDDEIIDNSISLNTLIDIKKYSTEDINPIFEFFKMTLTE